MKKATLFLALITLTILSLTSCESKSAQKIKDAKEISKKAETERISDSTMVNAPVIFSGNPDSIRISESEVKKVTRQSTKEDILNYEGIDTVTDEIFNSKITVYAADRPYTAYLNCKVTYPVRQPLEKYRKDLMEIESIYNDLKTISPTALHVTIRNGEFIGFIISGKRKQGNLFEKDKGVALTQAPLTILY